MKLLLILLFGVSQTLCAGIVVYDDTVTPLNNGNVHKVGSVHLASPLVLDHPNDTKRKRLIATGNEGVIYALDLKNLAIQWSFDLGDTIIAPLVQHNGLLFVANSKGEIASYRIAAFDNWSQNLAKKSLNIEPFWRYRGTSQVTSRPLVSGKKLIVTTTDHQVLAIDIQEGKLLWRYKESVTGDIAIRGNTAPVVVEGRIYVGYPDGDLVTLDERNGKLIARKKIANVVAQFHDVDANPVVNKGVLYVASYEGTLFAIDLRSGEVKWRFAAGSVSAVVPFGDRLYYASTDGAVYALSQQTGKVIWSYREIDSMPAGISVGSDVVAFGTTRGSIYILSSNGTLLWQHGLTVGATAAPIIDGNRVHFMSNNGTLYTAALQQY